MFDSPSSYGTDINSSGVVVGRGSGAFGPVHGYVWKDGVSRSLKPLDGMFSTTAEGINASGTIVGTSSNTFLDDRVLPVLTHGVVWTERTP